MTLNKVFEIMSSLALKSNVSPAVPDAVYINSPVALLKSLIVAGTVPLYE